MIKVKKIPSVKIQGDDPQQIQQVIGAGLRDMCNTLIERDDEIQMLFTALLCGEHSLLVGPPGCLHPDTIVNDPVDGSSMTVYQRFLTGKSFHVTSMDAQGNLISTVADKVWEYPEASMFKVTTQLGRTFTVTGHHRIWTNDGFRTVASIFECLRQCDSFHLPSILESVPSTQTLDASHSYRIPGDSTVDCPISSHFCDEQLPSDLTTALSASRQSVYAPGRTLLWCNLGAQDNMLKYTLYHEIFPRSMKDSTAPSGSPIDLEFGCPQVSNFVEQSYDSYSISELFFESPALDYTHESFLEDVHLSISKEFSSEQSPNGLSIESTLDFYADKPLRSSALPHTSCRFSSESSLSSQDETLYDQTEVCERPLRSPLKLEQGDHILMVEPAETSRYYDFHVPGYENYLACGVIHHNTAKTLLMETLAKFLEIPNDLLFKILFSKFTMPEEVFGPIDPVRMLDPKNPAYIRHIRGRLPEALLALLDEVARASPAILNTTLKVFNEKIYDRGDGNVVNCPLVSAIGCSNHFPGQLDGNSEDLSAFFDRLLFRTEVKPIQSSVGIDKLLAISVVGKKLRDSSHETIFNQTLSVERLLMAQEYVTTMQFEEEAAIKHKEIIMTMAKEQIRPSDRRKKKSVLAVQAFAYLQGSQTVNKEHMEVLKYILWEDPDQRTKASQIIMDIAKPNIVTLRALLVEAREAFVDANTKDTMKATKLEEIRDKIEATETAMVDRKQEIYDTVDKLYRRVATRMFGVKKNSNVSVDASDDDGPS